MADKSAGLRDCNNMNERTGITELKGIGEKTGALFYKLGISTVGDLLRYYPGGYDVYEEPVPVSELEEGRVQTVSGAIWGRVQVSPNRRMPVTTVQIKDISGTIRKSYPAGAGHAQGKRTCVGAPGDFLSLHQI